MAFDYKKEYREFYMLPKKPGIVDVPEMYFIILAKRHMNEEKSWEHRSQLFIAIMVHFFKLFTASRRASTFSCVVAQLAQKRTPEWVSSTRSQYS